MYVLRICFSYVYKLNYSLTLIVNTVIPIEPKIAPWGTPNKYIHFELMKSKIVDHNVLSISKILVKEKQNTEKDSIYASFSLIGKTKNIQTHSGYQKHWKDQTVMFFVRGSDKDSHINQLTSTAWRPKAPALRGV